MRHRGGIVVVLGGIVAIAWWLARSMPPRPPEVPAETRTVPVAPSTVATQDAAASSYVPNDRCVACHAAQAAAWQTSHHARAMAVATADTVVGDFGDATFERDGVTTRFSRRDGRYVVQTEGRAGARADFDVRYTFGVDPLQQYLLALDDGHVQALPIAWDAARKRWFDLYPGEKTPPGDVLHWTGRYQSWNGMCASCHSTDVRKRYDAARDRYATTWSEIDVSCQSCHGLGARHVAWADERSTDAPTKGLVVDFAAGGAEKEIETCAPCHARRSELTDAPVPGDALYDDYRPSLLTPDLYHADGQQLGEVYEYGSFRQSRMYQAGVRCTDCHDPHGATLRAEGSALCVRCHQTSPDTARFPGLAARTYDAPAHHHHQAGSPGAACVACHMPTRNYMIVDARRDHAIRIPRPDVSVKLGTPNACAACHADHDAQWAADAVARWYGPTRRQERHYGEILAAGRAGRADAAAALATLVADASQPAIVRATAVDLLGGFGPANVAAIVTATGDPDPAVRVAAVGALDHLPPQDRIALVAPRLDDPVRAVRIEAARVLAPTAPENLDATKRRALERATAEYVAAQNASLDMPGSHLNLAVLREGRREIAAAETEYRTALRLDPDFTPARLNLARLLNGVGRNGDAEHVLRDGIARVPEQGDLHYSLGLLLAEDHRLADAEVALGRAAELLPERARVRYNHALALQQLGRVPEAEAALQRAQALDGSDREIVYALAVLYAQRGDWNQALASAERLATVAPDDPQVQAFVADLRRRAGRASKD
jgi:predicted CXXCH cytochrome family protein